jgi:hypothetical protein
LGLFDGTAHGGEWLVSQARHTRCAAKSCDCGRHWQCPLVMPTTSRRGKADCMARWVSMKMARSCRHSMSTRATRPLTLRAQAHLYTAHRGRLRARQRRCRPHVVVGAVVVEHRAPAPGRSPKRRRAGCAAPPCRSDWRCPVRSTPPAPCRAVPRRRSGRPGGAHARAAARPAPGRALRPAPARRQVERAHPMARRAQLRHELAPPAPFVRGDGATEWQGTAAQEAMHVGFFHVVGRAACVDR